MNDSSSEEVTLEKRKRIFQEELDALRERRLIPKSEYIRISGVYDRHYQQELYEQKRLKHEHEQSLIEPEKILGENQIEKVQESLIEEKASWELQEASGAAEPIMNDRKHEEVPIGSASVSLELANTPELKPEIKLDKPPQPVKPKKTPEQIRERNISVVLFTGVILLLLGGMILATSTWGNLNALLKVFFIGMVSVIFMGMAFIASRLKIKQTAFAFLTLASLFIPITILSASYYQIFGEYLSLNGGGQGLLGFLGGLLCLAIYVKVADYFKSKIFIFISIFTSGITCYFGIAFITPSLEWMFLVVGVLNVIVLLNVRRLNDQEHLTLFKPYIFQFLQFKVIVEAFVILTLFASSLTYSLTLILFSISFFIFAVIFDKKYHEMAFSALFTYGSIHFIYNSFLSEFMVIAFAFVPIMFTALSKYLANVKRTKLSKNFLYTSLIETGIVFIYINAMVYQEKYAQLFIALLIVAVQLAYVSLQSRNTRFTYPTVVVFNLAFVYLFFALPISYSAVLNLVFVLQVIQYLGLYLYNHHPRYSLFKSSIVHISSIIVFMVLTSKFNERDWLAVSLLLATISGLFFITYLQDNAKHMKENAIYGFPSTLILAFVSFYPYLLESGSWVRSNIPVSLYLMAVSLICIACAYAFRKKCRDFFPVFCYSGQFLSLLAFLWIPFDALQPLKASGVIAAAVAINSWSVHIQRKPIFWLPVVLTSAALYASLYEVFDFDSMVMKLAFVLFGPFVFFLIGEVLGKYSKHGRLYFVYASHLVNLAAIPVGYFLIIQTESAPILFVGQLLIYLVSALRTQGKWEKYVYTYLGFSVLFLQVHLFLENVEKIVFIASICLMITGAIITIMWAASNERWKKIIEYYLIPFILLTMSISILETAIRDFPPNWEVAWVGLLTVQFVLASYLLMKGIWHNYVAVPLSLCFIFYNMYVHTLPIVMALIFLLVCTAVMVLVSSRYFKGMFKQEGTVGWIDYYRIFGFLYVCSMNFEVFRRDLNLEELAIFVSLLLPGYVILMGRFTKDKRERSIYIGLTGILGLYPYWTIFQYADSLLPIVGITVLFACTVLMVILSRKYFKSLLNKGKAGISVDFYRIYGLLFLLAMNLDVLMGESEQVILEVMSAVLIPAYFIIIRSTTIGNIERKITLAAAILFSLYPYWVIANQFTIPAVLEKEADILPLFFVSTILLRKIFIKGKSTQYIESGIVFLLFLDLILDAMASNTLYDALIIGTVSLVAMLIGFMMKYKSYFIAGTGTILFNIYSNTTSMWSEMPWWLYLIIGGGLLIGIASFFEWKKQKDNRTSKEVLEKNKQRIKDWFNRWN
ncbi:hypothetical protein [Peribacillus muralis]|uniref:hypothetical protein n=1 Tax=Peribacillus muralis TaxID=264697 RepID=UPI00070D8C3F|nr:hypothetical protein [Peribacillus muralis]